MENSNPSGFIYDAIKELNEALMDIEDVLKSTTLSAETITKLIKIKDVIEDVESGLAHC